MIYEVQLDGRIRKVAALNPADAINSVFAENYIPQRVRLDSLVSENFGEHGECCLELPNGRVVICVPVKEEDHWRA